MEGMGDGRSREKTERQRGRERQADTDRERRHQFSSLASSRGSYLGTTRRGNSEGPSPCPPLYRLLRTSPPCADSAHRSALLDDELELLAGRTFPALFRGVVLLLSGPPFGRLALLARAGGNIDRENELNWAGCVLLFLVRCRACMHAGRQRNLLVRK